MNTRRVKTLLLTIALLSLHAAAARAQEKGAGSAQQGELKTYEHATQIGTVANRESRDTRGRTVKTVYYEGEAYFQTLAGIESLRVQSIRLTTYDEYNCPVKNETYDPGMKLLHTVEMRCHPGTATPHFSTGRNARGVKQSETLHRTDGRTQTSLHFDEEGERVVAIGGGTPTDADLLHGWGEQVAGFASGIAASRERGRQSELRVWVTIKNIAHREEGDINMISPVAFELRDADGRPVAPKGGFDMELDESAGTACPAYEARGVPPAGGSELLRSYELGERYNRLPPGRYSVVVKHCLSTKRQLIVSNTIYLDVTGQE